MESIEEQYHDVGNIVQLSDGVEVVVVKRYDVKRCNDCFFKNRVDCGDIACCYNQRSDREDVIFMLKT